MFKTPYLIHYVHTAQVGDSCPLKWNAMKEKRDQRYAREEAREIRAQMVQSMGRLVIKTEKYVQVYGTYDT